MYSFLGKITVLLHPLNQLLDILGKYVFPLSLVHLLATTSEWFGFIKLGRIVELNMLVILCILRLGIF